MIKTMQGYLGAAKSGMEVDLVLNSNSNRFRTN